MKASVNDKAQMVAGMQEGLSWKEVIARKGITSSRATLYRWVQRTTQGGQDGLQDRRRGHPFKFREEVCSWLTEYYQANPRATGNVVQHLVQERFDLSLSVTHLNRFRATLRAEGRLGEKGRA
jgi:transposase